MSGVLRRLFDRRCQALLWLSASLAGCDKPAGSPLIEKEDVQVELGLGGTVDRGSWNILKVRLRNRGEDFQGDLEVRGIVEDPLSGPDPTTYRLPLEIAGKGAAREVSIPVRPQGWGRLEVRLRQGGFSRDFAFDLPLEELGIRGRVLWVGDRLRDFSALLDEAGELLSPGQADGQKARIAGASVAPGALPGMAAAYDPLQLVVLDGTALTSAPPGAIGALRRWVESGGTLLAFPGADWESGFPEELGDLLGIALGDPGALMPPALEDRLGPGGRDGFYRQLRPRAGAEEMHEGLVFLSRRGAGLCVASSFRPAGDAFPRKSRLPALHEALAPGIRRAFSSMGYPRRWLDALERLAPSALLSLAGVSAPPPWLVALALGGYLVLGFMVPAWIFNRLRKREWTFAFGLVAAGLASFAIYRWGLLGGRETAEIHEITILRVHADGKTAEATSFVGAIAPGVDRVDLMPRAGEPGGTLNGAAEDVESPATDVLMQPLCPRESPFVFRGGRRIRVPQTTLEADLQRRLRLPPARLQPNGMRFFRFDYPLRLDGLFPLNVRRAGEGRVRSVTIRNQSRCPLDASLLRGGSHSRLQEVSAGAAERIYSRGDALGQAWESLSSPPPREFFAGNDIGDPRAPPAADEDRIRRRVLQALAFPGALGEDSFSGANPQRSVEPQPVQCILAVGRQSVFPGGGHVPVRKAITVLVLELEP